MKSYKQGVFKPLNPQKYVGSVPIYYRSSWELKGFRICDSNNNIIEWASESIAIPYLNPAKTTKDGRPKLSRYYPDLYFKIKDKNGQDHKCVVEIKPLRQTLPPKTQNRKSKMGLLREQITYAQNMAKWEAAKKWCDINKVKFMILTENDLDKI
jgi:hypothetical protein